MPLLEVGRIVKPHGLRGEVVVQLLSDRDERLRPGSILYTDDGQLTVVVARPHQDRHLVLFAGHDDRSTVEGLRGVRLYGEVIADPEVLWVHELVGRRVQGIDGQVHGTVTAVVANPASDLLELDSGALVPLVFLVVPDEGLPDDPAAPLVIDPPDGLFDL